MSKRKFIAILGGATLLIATGGGFWFWQSHKAKQPTRTASLSNQGQTLAQTTDANSIPLTKSQPQGSQGTSLKVAPDSSVDNIGQFVPNGALSSPSSSSSSSSGSKALDPSKFGEYDKYKNEQNALFADIQAGSGDELTSGKKAAVYYAGWLTNGKLFDMSRTGKDGKLEPFVFTMGAHEVIPGWEQALAGMKAGGTRLVIVPPIVGYGASGQGSIPGNAVLVFQVQLLAVQ